MPRHDARRKRRCDRGNWLVKRFKADAETASSAVRSQFDQFEEDKANSARMLWPVKLLGYREIRSESRMKFTADVAFPKQKEKE